MYPQASWNPAQLKHVVLQHSLLRALVAAFCTKGDFGTFFSDSPDVKYPPLIQGEEDPLGTCHSGQIHFPQEGPLQAAWPSLAETPLNVQHLLVQ